MAIIGTLPNNIQNGRGVDAGPVMADFNYIVSQVNANAAAAGFVPAGTFLNAQVFLASGTYTPTPGMNKALAYVQAGGGAGGGSNIPSAGNVALGAPGSSGGFVLALLTGSQIGASQAVTVGAGGVGVAGAGGNNGSASSIGTLAVSFGGPGGGPTGTVAPPVVGGNGIPSTASTTTGVLLFSTRGLSTAFSLGFSAGVGVGGAGGSSYFGGGGQGSGNAQGIAALNYGAGGGGTFATSGVGIALTGGAGGPGIVIIYEYS